MRPRCKPPSAFLLRPPRDRGAPFAPRFRFNSPSEILERLDFYPGNFSPEYGRQMGGIIDLGFRAPRKDRFGGLVQFDLLDGRLLAEGPLGPSTRFLVAGRRSWVDAWRCPQCLQSPKPGSHDVQLQLRSIANRRRNALFADRRRARRTMNCIGGARGRPSHPALVEALANHARRAKGALGPFITAAAVLSSAGCGGDFDPGSRVTDLRVLAVRADAPYAAPGQTVHLDALAVDPAGRAIAWGWGLCVNPASATAPACLAVLDGSTVFIAKGMPSFDFALPSDVITQLPTEAAAHASVGAVVAACPGELTVQSGTLPFRCVDASGHTLGTDEYVIGVKRVFARRTDRNENPVLSGVTWDGAEWLAADVKEVVACGETGNDFESCSSSEQHTIAVALPAASVESGVDSFGTPFEEQVVVQYYATEGIFEHDMRLASDTTNRWTARAQSAGRTVTMWFVLRDDRGGVPWESRRVHVAER
jgi:hypothetical protein